MNKTSVYEKNRKRKYKKIWEELEDFKGNHTITTIIILMESIKLKKRLAGRMQNGW